MIYERKNIKLIQTWAESNNQIWSKRSDIVGVYNYAHATSHKLNMHTSMINTNIKHTSKTVWIACDPKTFWFIQTWMETSNHIWFKCPGLYLWMDAYIYNNMSAIRDKHEQKTYTEHNKNPTRKECGHTHIHITYIFVQTSRQTRFKYVFSCVHTIFSTGSHWPNHATTPQNFTELTIAS